MKRRRSPDPIPAKAREALKRRARNCCERCGIPDHVRACQAHHKLRKSQGGTHTLDNLAYLCFLCHSWVHGHIEEAIAAGWLTRPFDRDATAEVQAVDVGGSHERFPIAEGGT